MNTVKNNLNAKISAVEKNLQKDISTLSQDLRVSL
ncbi:hypothetical protein [Borreliella garinii]|nr:hypothetical protein [Borreliella garinii]